MQVIHPYTRYEQTPLWKALDKGIDDLVKNNDIEELTRREYIVGYLCDLIDGMKVKINYELHGALIQEKG